MEAVIEIGAALALNVFLWIWFALAVFVWRATANNRRLRYVGFVLLLCIWAISTRPVADLTILPLESQYQAPSFDALKQQDVRDVVVLTGGGFPIDGDLLTSGLPHASAMRFMSGLEICSQIGANCHLFFSGSSGAPEDLPTAQVMQSLAHEIDPQALTSSESKSSSTIEHPVNVKALVGTTPFVLVTSAYHMPRAMAVFTKAGLHAIPYPVDYYAFGGYSWLDVFPSAGNLGTIHIALHEYVGLAWYWVRYLR